MGKSKKYVSALVNLTREPQELSVEDVATIRDAVKVAVREVDIKSAPKMIGEIFTKVRKHIMAYSEDNDMRYAFVSLRALNKSKHAQVISSIISEELSVGSEMSGMRVAVGMAEVCVKNMKEMNEASEQVLSELSKL